MTRVHFFQLATSGLALVVFYSCAADQTGSGTRDPVVASLVHLEEALTQIGVVDGTHEYQFFRITGAVRLSNGNLVIANTGTSELRFYDSAGVYLYRSGGFGSGPGEFRSLKGVHEIGPDTILAFDRYGRKSYFDGRGEFIESENVQLVENRFPMDIWLYRRNWVVGVADNAARRREAAIALDRLPQPGLPPFYNYVRVDAASNLWVSEGANERGSRDLWTVYTAHGAPITRVRLPERFTISWIGTTEILGVWRDENDIEFLRAYPFALPARGRTVGDTVVPPQTDSVSDTVTLDVVVQESRALLRMMVTAQEKYFANHLSYTGDINDLAIEVPELLTVDLLEVSGTGWLAVLVHHDAPGICGIGLGSHTPAGWMEGVPTCAQLTPQNP